MCGIRPSSSFLGKDQGSHRTCIIQYDHIFYPTFVVARAEHDFLLALSFRVPLYTILVPQVSKVENYTHKTPNGTSLDSFGNI